VSKLYISSTLSDTSQTSRQALKNFLENVILNNPNNTSLVKRCNYYVQKTKVLLKQYQSAMTGFQQIIQQNPYSYEALVAHWDYMATNLLYNLSGGGISSAEEDPLAPEGEKENNQSALISLISDKSEFDDDKSPFTKEERKVIRTAVNDVQVNDRKQTEKKIEILTRDAGIGKEYAARELKQLKTLEEVVQIKHPKNITEHIKIVSEDVSKVFGVTNNDAIKKINSVPLEFNLYQNYPNPFNPVTTIKYDIPVMTKVKLVIYDLLGREVKTLVNNEIKEAGRYTLEFNASGFASGVYFYQLTLRLRSGNDMVMSRKMVVVK
jgi:tetratricopeptide (TPR) repeat protein